MAPIARDEADLVIGSRVLGGAGEPGALTPAQRFGNRLATALLGALFGVRASDLGPFRAIRWEALERLGMRDRDYGELTYTFDDVVATLNAISPHDWKAFLRERLDGHGPAAPLDGLTRSGWKLVYREEQSSFQKAIDEVNKSVNLGFSLGLVVSTKDKGNVTEVVWDSPAFRAGLTTATKLIAVNGQEFAPEVLLEAIRAAKGTNQPIELLVKTFDRYTTVLVPYFEGLRYPDLERIDGTDDRLTAILKSRT